MKARGQKGTARGGEREIVQRESIRLGIQVCSLILAALNVQYDSEWGAAEGLLINKSISSLLFFMMVYFSPLSAHREPSSQQGINCSNLPESLKVSLSNCGELSLSLRSRHTSPPSPVDDQITAAAMTNLTVLSV